MGRTLVLFGIVIGLLGPAGLAAAERVEPTEKVRSYVVVRAEPRKGARRVGALHPRERAEYLGASGDWRRVRLLDGQTGFVSAAWTVVRAGDDASARAAKPVSGWARWFGGPPRKRSRAQGVEVVIRDPAGSEHRSEDPVLPVAGFARLANGAHLHDIVLVLDLSTSTNEHSQADVNGDGVVDDGFKGPDSVFAAQIAAARAFLRAVGELPHNDRGARIRVGVVTYAGDEKHHLAEADRALELDADTLHRLAARDADVLSPLTRDYASIDLELRRLAKRTPVGMTNAAAGVMRALAELEGLSVRGAESEARVAQKVILFLTDGKPRLPYDRDEAEAAALLAGRMAGEAGVRINAFTLGRNRVTRKNNDAVRRMATRTGGVHRQLITPGRIVKALEATPFSVVEQVQIVNRTTRGEAPPVATGLDGSFYSEVGVVEGRNELEVVAKLSDGREQRSVFHVDFVEGRPQKELALELARVRKENRALIDQIKKELALEIVAARKRQAQRKGLRLEVDEKRTPPAAQR